MSRQRPVAAGVTIGERTRRWIRLAGSLVSGTVLVASNLVALFFTGIGWMMIPEGFADDNLIEGAWWTAFIGTLFAAVTWLLTMLARRAGWLGRWWLVAPAVLFVASTVRWAYIGWVYDLPPA